MSGRRRRVGARPPWALVPLAAVTLAFLVVPFLALLQRAPWSSLGDRLTDPVVTEALRLSLVSAFAATGLSLLGGVPLAWMLARTDFPGRSLAWQATHRPSGDTRGRAVQSPTSPRSVTAISVSCPAPSASGPAPGSASVPWPGLTATVARRVSAQCSHSGRGR